MASKIQVKRGNRADLPILSDGEFGLCQDTGEIFIGNGGSNIKIYPSTALTASNVTVDDAGGMFESTNAEGALAELAMTILEILSGAAIVGKAEDSNKVGGFTVAKSVPSNAAFTDTVTTVNGKTGAISKTDIVALGIPAQDTVYTHPATHAISEISGLQGALDGKVDDSQVLTNVPVGAKFTDTVYTHPTTAGNKHIPSGGASGNLLGYSASGTAQWVAPSTINAGQVDGKSVWVGAEGSKGTDANTIYFCY